MTSHKPAEPLLRLVIVDDHQLFRAGVRAELIDSFEIVGEAATPAEAVTLIQIQAPDVVLLDVHLPDGGGLAVLAEFALNPAAPAFLALSVSDSPEDVIPMVRAGACGYVTKTIETPTLVKAIRTIHQGEPYFSPRLAAFILQEFSTPATQDEELNQLTPREQEVLSHLARGYPYKQIALKLKISPRTVETHVSSVLRKLQLSTRHELSYWATTRGLVD